MPFDSLINSLQLFESNIDDIVTSLASKHEDEIVRMNVERIVDEHRYISGELITPVYAAVTQEYKGFENPNLFSTGSFIGKLAIRDVRDGIEVFSRDSKYKEGLLDKYSEDGDFLGLSDEGLDLLSSYVKPDLIDAFRETVGV